MTQGLGVLRIQVRRGAYYDSVVLMQVQRALATLDGVLDAGVVMGTPANKAILSQSDLLDEAASGAQPEDLVVCVRARDDGTASRALEQVDDLLARRASVHTDSDYLPRSLVAAATMLPEAGWVLVSTPGRYAAQVAGDALAMGKNVFLYSDNVSLEDEVRLKQTAAASGLLVMGPDCGTAIVGGVGLGFANRVRRGPIGLVGASGTGLQYVTARIHQLGSGITHALGAGGRDLSEAVGGMTTAAALDLLASDADTQVIVLISKPPAPEVAGRLIDRARASGKPVVVNFIGMRQPAATEAGLFYATSLDECAAIAVQLGADRPPAQSLGGSATGRFVRGLYSGGTLAYEAQLVLRRWLQPVWSNAPLEKSMRIEPGAPARGHTILDLGEDEFTVGRLHPMLDNQLRIARLLKEAADSQAGVLLLDVVLGDGAHADPASELGPAISEALALAAQQGRVIAVVALLVGTDEDPQNLEMQRAQLAASGAEVFTEHAEALARVVSLVASPAHAPHAAATLNQPFAALNVGLASFAESLRNQGAQVQHVDWRPPAGGNERLAGILANMKQQR